MGTPAAAEAAVAEAATSERDVLLATKLNVPGLRPDLVPRPRLAQRLDEGRGRGLVLACAPAGYGKTVLLAEWIRRVRHPVAWLSLDADDNDPARFWRHAVAALDRARPGISERMGPLLGPPPPPSFEPLVTALINELPGQPDADEALLLVLDDYHVISSPPVHESLGFLLEHRPPGLQLALTSRSDPPLALARLRARGQLTELRAAELRFTPPEAAALLQQVAAGPGGAWPGAPLPDEVAAALAARTEGWAARLQLAGLSLRGRSDVDGFVAAFTGSHRYVLDYLAEEVLEHQPEQARTFLHETSVLERLAWIRQAGGDPAGALDAMDEAVQATPGPPGLLNPIPTRRARQLLAQGDLAAADRWTQENNLPDEPDYAREPGYLVLGRVLLAQGRPARALVLLDRLYAAATAQDRTGSLIEIGALRALALAASGQDADAVNALAGALTLACPQGYVRVFADEGPPMAALLAQLIAAQRSGSGFGAVAEVPLGCLARLRGCAQHAGRRAGSRPGRPADQP